ncbi:hypothetical protein [Muribaculum intestinale]|uniref:hypothetical protein n=1 Tax=Muribaculum intestinale TaxID=1796646 RepID=UPI00272DC3EC|nr:hypothetical protein [Muribaculum intestinale]
MIVKRKSDGKVIEVEPQRFMEQDGSMYAPSELDFNVEEAEEVTIDGWVAIDEAYNDCFLHTSKPHQESQAIADTGDYDTVWESDGKTYLLDKGFFPAMDSESDPLEVTITIKPKKKQ